MPYWLVTYKRLTNKDVTEQHHYDDIMMTLHKKGIMHDYNFEKDSHGKLHLHVVFEMVKNSYINNFRHYGFHMNFTPIKDDPYDIQRARDYIHKNDKLDKYAFDDNYYIPS